jgi:HK97 gp10 family phage protein
MVNAASIDLSNLAKDLMAAGTSINVAAQKVIQDTAMRVQSEAQSRAPVKSGRLRNSISIKYPNPLTAIIGPQVEYGVYQEFGTGSRGEFPTGPYKITAKPGKLLRFKVGAKIVYARSVTHPGVRARHYMRDAVEATLGSELLGQMAAAGQAQIIRGPNA